MARVYGPGRRGGMGGGMFSKGADGHYHSNIGTDRSTSGDTSSGGAEGTFGAEGQFQKLEKPDYDFSGFVGPEKMSFDTIPMEKKDIGYIAYSPEDMSNSAIELGNKALEINNRPVGNKQSEFYVETDDEGNVYPKATVKNLRGDTTTYTRLGENDWVDESGKKADTGFFSKVKSAEKMAKELEQTPEYKKLSEISQDVSKHGYVGSGKSFDEYTSEIKNSAEYKRVEKARENMDKTSAAVEKDPTRENYNDFNRAQREWLESNRALSKGLDEIGYSDDGSLDATYSKDNWPDPLDVYSKVTAREKAEKAKEAPNPIETPIAKTADTTATADTEDTATTADTELAETAIDKFGSAIDSGEPIPEETVHEAVEEAKEKMYDNKKRDKNIIQKALDYVRYNPDDPKTSAALLSVVSMVFNIGTGNAIALFKNAKTYGAAVQLLQETFGLEPATAEEMAARIAKMRLYGDSGDGTPEGGTERGTTVAKMTGDQLDTFVQNDAGKDTYNKGLTATSDEDCKKFIRTMVRGQPHVRNLANKLRK